ncbi:MAG: hypothetical protein SGI91_12365 [Alphaproteobacteria bacterium]|nr:hypothetical protein [Alphaproteobacteria bacterium]
MLATAARCFQTITTPHVSHGTGTGRKIKTPPSRWADGGVVFSDEKARYFFAAFLSSFSFFGLRFSLFDFI